MPFPTPSLKFITTGQGAGCHGHVYAVTDRQLANYLIHQGGARVLQIDADPTLTIYQLQANVDLTPLIRQYTEAMRLPQPVTDGFGELFAELGFTEADLERVNISNAHAPAPMTDAQQTEAVASAINAHRAAARRAGKNTRRKQINQVLHECKRRLQAALANEKGRLRGTGIAEHEVLAILGAAAAQLPEFIARLNRSEIS